MSRSQFQLKQKLHYTSENSKERGYQHGQCRVYRVAPDKVVFEVSEDPRKKDLSQIRSVYVGKHDNILCIRTTDDTKYLNFDSRLDMIAWCNTIKGLIQTCNLEEVEFVDDNEGASTPFRPRAQTVLDRRHAQRGNRPTRPLISSPATPDDMFRQMVHSDRELKPVSPDGDSPLYENSNFNPQLLEQRDAYLDKHELTKLQEENYQPLIHAQEEDTYEDPDEDDDNYENVGEVLPSQLLPLKSKNEPEQPSEPARRKALLPPNSKKLQEKMATPLRQHPHLGPASRNSSGSIISRPEDLRSNESIGSRPGSLRSNESIVSRPGSLHSNENGYYTMHTLEQDHPLPIHDQQWTQWRQPTDRDDDSASQSHMTEAFPDQSFPRNDADQLRNSLPQKKSRPPMPPPKHTKPKPTAQVIPQSTSGDGIYANADYPLDHHGREPEAKCDIKERVTTIRRRDGSVSSFEVEKNLQIPRQECKVEDVCLADTDGAVIIQRTNLSTYLEVGDQLLQINDIDVEHKGKDFAHICLNSVSSTQINLKILRKFHPK